MFSIIQYNIRLFNNDKYALRMVEVVQIKKYMYQIVSIIVFVQHLYEKMIDVKSTSFRDYFVVSPASEVILYSA